MVSVSPAVPNRSKRPSNKKSMLLSDEENYALFRLLTERNSVTLASGVVQVLKAEPTRHMWRRIAVGVGCVVKDFKECSYFIRVYDLLNDSVCFEQRLYDEFHAIQPSQTLITFEGDQCRIGLNFASPDEAQFFHGKLDRKRQRDIEDRDQKRRALTQQNGRAESNVYHSQANTNNANRAYRNGPESMNEQNVFGMASTRAKKPRKKGKGAKLKKEDISKPVPDSFSHKFHVGFDPHKGMQTSGAGEDLDPVIFNFLKSAGKDPTRMSRNAMNEVYQIIDSKGGVDQLKMEMEQKKMSSPQRPAYPPAPSQKQAPPPANSRSMPPPPPPRTDSIASPAATRPGPPPPPSAYPSRGPPPAKQSLPPQPTRPPGGPPPPPPPPTAKPHKQMAPPPPRAAPVRAPAAVGGGPPPPPAPPPPPPILVSDAPKGVPAENSGRADLMAAIRGHGGTNNMQHMPDPMDKRSSGGSSDGRDALLGEIRQGPKLKHVDPNAPRPPPPPEAGGGGMMEALTRALQSRREGIAPSDSDSDEESESSSDGGWSDEDL